MRLVESVNILNQQFVPKFGRTKFDETSEFMEPVVCVVVATEETQVVVKFLLL
jgi:hypothetical protein